MSEGLHVKAHNALAAAVEMYRSILQEYQDREKVLLSNVQMLKTQLAEAKAQLQSANAVREPEAKREVPRDGGARRDLALDGGALGQGEQGQEASGPKVKEERSIHVGEAPIEVTYAGETAAYHLKNRERA
jgi:hypothetical protein